MSKIRFRNLVFAAALPILMTGGCAKSATSTVRTPSESEPVLITEGSDVELESPPSAEAGYYFNETHRFSLRVPADWELKEGFLGTIVVALSPPDGPDDRFRENVNVMVDDPNPFKTAEEYLVAGRDNMGKLLTDFVEVDRASETINDIGVVWMVYEHRMGNLKLKVIALFAVRENRGYVLTCSSTPQDFQRHEQLFKNIISSFTFR